jgi:hypothetical protein
VLYLNSVMAHIRSTAHPHDVATEAGSGGHGDSADRKKFALLSDVGSHSEVGADVDEGSRTWSYFFGPSTVTASYIRAMIDNDYFDEGMGHESGEETVPEP